jgi:hypothetical protein
VRVVLVTAAVMPKPDPEAHLVVEALTARGVDATLRAWDASNVDWSGAELVVVQTPWDYRLADRLMADAALRWGSP